MNVKSLEIQSILSVSLLLIFPIHTLSQSPQSYSWSVTPPNVASVAWTNQQIGAFLDAVTASSVPATVADFRLSDLDSDGQLELLATVDYSGRQLFNTVVVVRRPVTGFTVQQIETLEVQQLQGNVTDLNNDARQELLLPKAITPYLGVTGPQAKWTAIYGWSGPLLVDVSAQFSPYYQATILPALKQVLDNLLATAPGSIQADVAQIEYDKALRVSGQDPNAGLSQSLAWALSADAMHRIFAAAVLADIGTTPAVGALTALTTDQDPNVVIYAQASVQSVSELHFIPVQIDIKPWRHNEPH